jgi:hypothetical protein
MQLCTRAKTPLPVVEIFVRLGARLDDPDVKQNHKSVPLLPIYGHNLFLEVYFLTSHATATRSFVLEILTMNI